MDITIIETAIARLQTIAAENPGIREAALFYQRLIPAMNELGKEIPGITIDRKALDQKFAAGIPLLVGEMLEFDITQSRRIFETIGAVAVSTGNETSCTGQKVRDIQAAIESGELDPLRLIAAVERGEAGRVAEIASRLGLDPQMLEMLAQNTLKVFLRDWRSALETQVNLDDWRRCPCPFCGANAALAEIRGVEAARFLRCLRCGAGWPYPNLHCAFCGNDDHKSLGILLIESKTCNHYVHTCERCKRYIKTVITFDPVPIDLLMVEDLATLQLDVLAAEKGYVK